MADNSHLQVYIKNFPYDIDNKALSEWCSMFGPIVHCTVKRDQYGNSRGFGFVTFANVDGYNKILNGGPYECKGRRLIVRSSGNDTQVMTSTHPTGYSPEPAPQSTSYSTIKETTDATFYDHGNTFDHNSFDNLASLNDELDANIECTQIEHAHEIDLLKSQLEREKRLLSEAQDLYKVAEGDWEKVKEENARLRTALVKNVMQTFNIRRSLARQTKQKLNECARIDQEVNRIQSNLLVSNCNRPPQS